MTSPLPDDDPVPRIGRYRVRGLLGRGGFGSVYRATDDRLNREVAVKVPHPGVLARPDQLARFEREARVAAGLRHPNIVPIYDASTGGERPYIAFAFVDGKTLADAARGGRVPVRRAVGWIAALADALAYAHAAGVLHRDVKPENVLVDADHRPHLTDFGLARQESEAERMTRDGSVTGTPGYLSPETITTNGQRSDAAADQYSLGVMLYELLAGRMPFEGTADVVYFHTVHTPPPPLRRLRPEVPRDLETVCLKAMAKGAGDRYAGCGELAADLGRWLAGEPVFARRESLPRRAGRWVAKEPLLSAAVGLAVLCLLAVVGVAANSARQQAELAAAADAAKADAERERDGVRRLSAELSRRLYASKVRRGCEAINAGDWAMARQDYDEAVALTATPGPELALLRHRLRELDRSFPLPLSFEPAALGVSRSGQWLVATGSGRLLRWDMTLPDPKPEEWTLPDDQAAANRLVVSPDGDQVLVFEVPEDNSGRPGGLRAQPNEGADTPPAVAVWSKRKVFPLPDHTPALTAFAFTADGGAVVAGDGGGGVWTWPVRKGAKLARLFTPPAPTRPAAGPLNPRAITRLVTAGGGKVAAVAADSQVTVWDGKTARRLTETTGGGQGQPPAFFHDPDHLLYFTAAGDRLEGFGGTPVGWNLATGTRDDSPTPDRTAALQAGGVALPAGMLGHISTEYGGFVVAAGESFSRDPVGDKALAAVVLPGGTRYAVATRNRVLVLRAACDGRTFGRANQEDRRFGDDADAGDGTISEAVEVSADGRVAVGVLNGKLWAIDTATGEPLGSAAEPAGVTALTLSADGTVLLAGTDKGAVLRWVTAGKEGFTGLVPAGGGGVKLLEWVSARRYLIGRAEGGLVVRDTEAAAEVPLGGADVPVARAAVSADGAVAVGVSDGGKLWAWRLDRPAAPSFTADVGVRAVGLATSADGRLAAVVGEDGQTHLVPMSGEGRRRVVRGTDLSCLTAAFLGDDRLITLDSFGRWEVWDLSGEEVLSVYTDSCGEDAESTSAATAGGWSPVRLRVVTGGKAVVAVRSTVSGFGWSVLSLD